MYAARFRLGNCPQEAAVVAIELRGGVAALPDMWRRPLLDARDCDFALRVTWHEQAVALAVLLNSFDSGAPQALAAQLCGALPCEGYALAAESREAFDRVAGSLPPHQAWMNHCDYHHAGQSLGTDFRLFPLIEHISVLSEVATGHFVYQCNCHRRGLDREEERSVRKTMAAMRSDGLLPGPMIDLQAQLARRLLAPGFETDELIAVGSAQAFVSASAAIRESFAETMGGFGFSDSPLEAGSYDDMFETGIHSRRLAGAPPASLGVAATVLSNDHVLKLLAVEWRSRGQPIAAPALGRVFISYSSNDYVQARLLCQRLEAAGISCWMAPRDISPGASYPEAIVRGIENCVAFIVILSSASNLSPHVQREVERALNHRTLIVPFRVEDVIPTGAMEYLLSTCHWVDAFTAFEPAITLVADCLRPVVSGK